MIRRNEPVEHSLSIDDLVLLARLVGNLEVVLRQIAPTLPVTGSTMPVM